MTALCICGTLVLTGCRPSCTTAHARGCIFGTVWHLCDTERCDMHVRHAYHMHEPGPDVRILTCDVWWASHIGAAHICNIIWCIC